MPSADPLGRRDLAVSIAVPLVVLALIEILAWAPASDLLVAEIWWIHVLGTAALGVALWVVAAAGVALGRAIPRRAPAASDVGLALVFVIVGLSHLWGFVAPWIWRHSLPRAVGLAVSVAVSLVAYVVFRRWSHRVGLHTVDRAVAAASLLALPTLARAALEGSLPRLDSTSPRAVVAVAAVLFAVGLFAAHGWRTPTTHAAVDRSGRRLRVGLVLVLAVVALRLGTVNRHALEARPESSGKRADGPPVLLIVLDTFRADAVDYRSGESSRTPAIARLADVSDVYSQAIANASWTLPGHASLFTGRYLHEHRMDATTVPGFSPTLPEHTLTLQERFGAGGYRTSAVVANPVIGPKTGLTRGFERYRQPGHLWMMSTLPLRLLSELPAGPLMVPQLLAEVFGFERDAAASAIVGRAIEEIDHAAEQDRGSLYLFLNFMDTHPPNPPPDDLPLRMRGAMIWHELRTLCGLIDTHQLFRDQIELVRDYYAARVPILDAELGRLFETLRERGVFDDYLIIVTSDHGEAMYDNPDRPAYFGHHGAFEPAVRIPLLIKRPGQRHGRRFDHLVQQVDVAAATLAGAGLPSPPDLDPVLGMGDDFAAARADRPIVTEWYPRGYAWDLQVTRFGLYDERFKLVLEGESGIALFDLERSPYESLDVSSREGERTADLRRKLESILSGVRSTGGDDVEMSPEIRKQLEALGYLQ